MCVIRVESCYFKGGSGGICYSLLCSAHLLCPEICPLRQHGENDSNKLMRSSKYGFLRMHAFTLPLNEISFEEVIYPDNT